MIAVHSRKSHNQVVIFYSYPGGSQVTWWIHLLFMVWGFLWPYMTTSRVHPRQVVLNTGKWRNGCMVNVDLFWSARHKVSVEHVLILTFFLHRVILNSFHLLDVFSLFSLLLKRLLLASHSHSESHLIYPSAR